MDATSERRIVLLGKTGTGKSSLGNTLLGDSLLKTKTSPTSETSECQAESKSINGRNITVIDTPGFFDTTMDEDKLKEEIVRCMVECAPGPHAFLIVLKVDRFTAQEEEVIKKVLGCFSEEALKFTTVVFTHGDELPERMTIEEFVCQNVKLSDLVKRCGGRCHVIDNKYWMDQEDGYRSNRFQVEQIFNTIDKIVMENKGGYYTNEMLQRVEEEIKKGGDVEWRILKILAGVAAGAVLGYFLGAGVVAVIGLSGAIKIGGAVAGAVVGGVIAEKVTKPKQAATSERRIVLLGKSGSGKSSLGNTLLGDSLLKTKTSLISEKSECQAESKSINGRNITVIDTPGFFDTTMDEDKLKKEIVRCMVECAPGPHAFLIVLEVARYTTREEEVIKKVLECFSEEALKFTTVVFTHGDQLPGRKRIEEFVCQSDRLSDLVKRCGGRCHVIDNKYWKNQEDEYRSNRFQVEQIFNTIDKTVMENKGGCYTNEMLKRVEEEKKQKKLWSLFGRFWRF